MLRSRAGVGLFLALALLAPPAVALAAVTPPNNDIATATPIPYPIVAPVEKMVDNSGATSEVGEAHPCGGSTRTVWYSITSPVGGNFSVVLVEDAGTPGGNLRVAAGRLQGGVFTTLGCGGGSWATVQVSAGSTSYVQVMDDGTGGGELRLRFSTLPAPANNAFLAAETVAAFPATTVPVDNRSATIDSPSEVRNCNASQRTVWYRFVAPGSGRVTVTPDMSLLADPTLQAFVQAGSDLSSLVALNPCASRGPLSFAVSEGAIYYAQASDISQCDPARCIDPLLETRGGTISLAFAFEPWVTLTLPDDITVEATGPDGAAVRFVATAKDVGGGDLTVVCDHPSGSTFALGTTTVSCTASDAAGNPASGTFDVTVVDTTVPSIGFGSHPATYTVADAVSITCAATDAVGVVETTCVDTTGPAWTFGTGTHELTFSATDAVGNTSTATTTFTVNVSYAAMKTLTSQWVWKAPLAVQLNAYLDAAFKAEQKGNLKAEASNLDGYRKLLAAQVGKGVSATDAGLLSGFTYQL